MDRVNYHNRFTMMTVLLSLVLLGRIAVLRTHYAGAAYCYRPSSVVCRSVTVVSPAKRLNRSRCRLGFGLRWAQGRIY